MFGRLMENQEIDKFQMLALIQLEQLWWDSQVGRRGSAKASFVGSIPTLTSIFNYE